MSESSKLLGESMQNFHKQVAKERIRKTTTYGMKNSANRYMINKYGPKIASFDSVIDYNKTDDPEYMSSVAKSAMRHFGFPDNVRVVANTQLGDTDYYLVVGKDTIVAGYRVPGQNKKLGSTLSNMVEDAILYKVNKREKSGAGDVSDLVDATGKIVGLKWRLKR